MESALSGSNEWSFFGSATGFYIRDRTNANNIIWVLNGAPEAAFGVASSEIWINDDGNDYDFRVESDTNTNMLFVDASTDRVGIGTNNPSKTLDVNGDISLEAGSGSYYSSDGSQGWTGTFTNGDGDTVTVKDGIITGVS